MIIVKTKNGDRFINDKAVAMVEHDREKAVVNAYGDKGVFFHIEDVEGIIYIVENDIEEDEVLEWEDYCLDAYEFKFTTPNLRAWHMGCPRTPQETFDRLRQLKADLAKAVEEEKQRTTSRMGR